MLIIIDKQEKYLIVPLISALSIGCYNNVLKHNTTNNEEQVRSKSFSISLLRKYIFIYYYYNNEL